MNRLWQACPVRARLLAIAILLAVSVTRAARADVVTFAQFNQQMVSDQSFGYTNNDTSASFNSVRGEFPIDLMITEGFAPGLDRLQSARLLLTSSTTARTIPPEPPDQLTREHFTDPANMIRILLQNGRNFLTVTFSDGLLSGSLNSSEASFKASDADSGMPRVSFTSDFIDFTDAIEHGFSLSFSSVNSTDGSGHLQRADNGFFKSFTASGTGTFDTGFPAPVPEPCSIILAGFGLLGLAYGCRSPRSP